MKPPSLAAALLRLCAPAADRAFIEDALAEEFARKVEADGRPAAPWWYRGQVLRSVPRAARDRPAGRAAPAGGGRRDQPAGSGRLAGAGVFFTVLAAAVLPATRGLRQDPSTALRAD